MNKKAQDADWQRIEQLWHEHDQRVELIAHSNVSKATSRFTYWWRYGLAAACMAAVAVTTMMWLHPHQPESAEPTLAVSHHKPLLTIAAEVPAVKTNSFKSKTYPLASTNSAIDITEESSVVAETEESCQVFDSYIEPAPAEELVAYTPEESIQPAEVQAPKRIVIEMKGMVTYSSQPKVKETPKTDLLGNPITEDLRLFAMAI